jgi:hypothetical protein
MATLDKIIEMKQKGMADAEISRELQNEGISPTEINDSLNQAQIKAAVTSSPETQMPQTPMQQSIMQSPQGMPPAAQVPQEVPQAPMPPAAQVPQAPEEPLPPEQYPPAQQQDFQEPMQGEPLPPEQDQYYQQTPQAYSGQEFYPQQGAADTETISEIAEQVFSEKISEFKQKIGDVTTLKNEIKDKVADLDDRLKRIEDNIDKLQQAVIGKVGEFGESAALIHKDLNNLHETTSKLMNPLVDNYKELQKIAESKE